MSLIRADAINIPLQDGTVDLIVTSPPYFALRSYTDGGEHYDGQIGSEPTPQDFLEALWAVTAECARVLKPSGSIWVNLGDKYSGAQAQNTKARNGDDSARTWQQTNPRNTGIPAKSLMGLPWRYAIGCIDQLGLILRAEVIWSKPNGLPESVTDRVRRSHEQWFHFSREPRYYAAVDEVRAERETGSVTDRKPGRLTVWNGLSGSCPRCGKRVGAGSGQPGEHLPGTASSTSGAKPFWPTESATSSTSDESPRGSTSTTSAATEHVSTPRTSSPSPSEPTYCEATPSPPPTASRLTASTGTSSTMPTPTESLTEAACAECVCEPGTGPGTGGSRTPLGSLPGSVWTIPSEPLKVPDHLGVDHFAAYPQEWPRRIILGWSPPGICTRCGDGRRPVVEKGLRQTGTMSGRNKMESLGRHKGDPKGQGGWDEAGYPSGVTEATITGYACQCPEPDAPTRPAVVLDPFSGTGTTVGVARTLGRYGVGLDLSADYLRLAEWRIYKSGHFAKTVARTNGERRGAGRGDLVNLPAAVDPDQLDLFGGAA